MSNGPDDTSRDVGYLRIRNFWDYQNADAWKKAQANKGSKHPAWCKLFAARDQEIDALPVVTRLVWYELLRLATVNMNAMSNDSQAIAKDISIKSKDVAESIEILLKGGWIVRSKSNRPSRILSREPSRKSLESFATKKKKELKFLEGLELPIETPVQSNGAANPSHLTRAERKRLPGHCPECGIQPRHSTVEQHLFAVHEIVSNGFDPNA